ncbi:MAG TPA: HlyD family efflux transporter periplasmic adaptor subunit [Pseudomonas sp.]|nr:HlyD family efflux transporter periplasmic adaptor subunit [Pseudomonas sp.]
MTSWRRLAWLLPGLLAPVLWWAWPAAEPPVADERWVWVEPQRLERRLGLVGKVQAARQEIQAAPFDAVVAALMVAEGQRVSAGQPLFRLDTAQVDVQIRQAEAEWLKARASHRQLQGWQAGPEVTRARRSVLAGRASLALSQAALVDTRRLFERGIVARIEVDSLAQQVSAQRQALQDAEDELQGVQARGQGDGLRIAQMELTNAQARWQALLALRKRQVGTAPFAALVAPVGSRDGAAARAVQAGQQVSQGTPLLALIDLGQLQVLAGVHEQDLAWLREGQEADVSVAGHLLVGKVRRIGLQARDDAGQGAWYDVLVELGAPREPTGLGLRLGMSAQLTVRVHRTEQGVAVPAQALRVDEAGRDYVRYRSAADGPERRVAVTVGIAVAQGVEVQVLQAGYVQVP